MSTSTPKATESASGFSRVMRPVNAVVERFVPSSLVFAIALSLVVMLGSLALTEAGPVDVIMSWGDGLAGLLEFMTQMALVLFLGYVLANTAPVRRLLRWLASIPRGRVMPYVFVALITCASALITWGLCLVVGALLSKEVARAAARRGETVHFPLLVAGGYTGMVVWHMGYSGSGPLTAATEDSFLMDVLGGEVVSMSQTTFSGWNMIAALVTILVVAATIAMMAPRRGDAIVTMPEHEDEADPEYSVRTPADRLDASRLVTLIPGLLLVAYLVLHYANGGTLTLDIVNWSFLTLILLLVRHPLELMDLTRKAAANVGEILLQFPLYAGIMGIMEGTGLIAILSGWVVATSSPETFGLLAFLSAGVVNFFGPSGGGQFAVQGPLMIDSAAQMGVDPEIAIMAVAYGDQWTNMIQPFWALPLLAIAGLKLREILGYTTMVLVTTGVVFAATMLVMGFLA